jgi:hypothetical protein
MQHYYQCKIVNQYKTILPLVSIIVLHMLPCNSTSCADLSFSEPRVGKSPVLKEKSSLLRCAIPYIRTVVQYQTHEKSNLITSLELVQHKNLKLERILKRLYSLINDT